MILDGVFWEPIRVKQLIYNLFSFCLFETAPVNGWGFLRKSYQGRGQYNYYYHDLFVRDDPEKSLTMVRNGSMKNAAGQRVIPKGDNQTTQKGRTSQAAMRNEVAGADFELEKGLSSVEVNVPSHVNRIMMDSSDESDRNSDNSSDTCHTDDDKVAGPKQEKEKRRALCHHNDKTRKSTKKFVGHDQTKQGVKDQTELVESQIGATELLVAGDGDEEDQKDPACILSSSSTSSSSDDEMMSMPIKRQRRLCTVNDE